MNIETNNISPGTAQFHLGRVMNRAFSGVFGNWKALALVIIPTILITMIPSIPTFMGIEQLSDPGTTGFIVSTIVTYILSFFSWMFMCILADILAFSRFCGRHVPTRDAVLKALKTTLPILFIVILYFISTQIGSLFFIVPGVIISVGWAVIGPVYLHEDIALFETFERSWSLAKGYKWWLFLAQILMNIIIFFVVLLAYIPVGLLVFQQGEQALAGELDITLPIILAGFLTNVILYTAFSLYASFTAALYAELKELKEGFLSDTAAAVFD